MKIPIANVYYLLSYAWKRVDESRVVDVAELDRLEHLHDLFGKVLAEGAFHLVRNGLDRGYLEQTEDLAGVRGKIAVGEMAKRALRARGRAACVFTELSHDVAHNRILRSTLANLLRVPELAKEVRAEVGLAFRKMEGVSVVRLDRGAFGRVQLDRNRRTYRFLLSICELVHESLLIDPRTGSARFRDFRDDDRWMWRVFEDFVTEFYRRELTGFKVGGQTKLDWHEASAPNLDDLRYVPVMRPDVLLESGERRIVLDAKYYQEAFGSYRGSRRLRSGNLYQLLSYLRNLQASKPEGPRHEGILLYPVVDDPFAVDVRLEGFRVQARAVDLGQEWGRIRDEMVGILG